MVKIVLEIVVEIVVELAVKAVVKTGCHTAFYNGPLQCQSGGLRHTILFTILSYSPITTV